MFCPKCATQNLDGASFCRSCGANISLVPQALTGQLMRASDEKSLTTDESCATPNRGKTLTLDQAFKNMFIGIAFLLIAIALSRSIGQGWWFWMLIPAFSLMGTGIAQYIRVREREKRFTEPLPPARHTERLMPPPVPSVTEGTTRHLNTKNSDHR